MEDESRELQVVSYDIEIWDWKTNTYVADISTIVNSDLDIEWVLNDVETVTFSVDLIQFEKKCKAMGVTPAEVLTPYVHDIRIRRNGEYIIGAQVVETNFQIDNDVPPKIQVKCTGFLNLFKDQYITESWSGYTYAQIARKLVEGAQKAENLVKNPTVDIDASYWLCPAGTMARTTVASDVHSGDGSIRVTLGSAGWLGSGTQINRSTGSKVQIDVWVKGVSGQVIYFRERELVTVSSNQMTIGQITGNGSWQHFTADYYTYFDKGYLYIEQQSSTKLCIDDCYIYPYDEYDDDLCDLNVSLGFDTASANQKNTRQRNYQLQNIKDALMNLTSLEDDNFDFSFSPDRTFNCYDRKGSDKMDLEILYPGNIHSMSITRSAANLANKIINIGSGIGDERIEVVTANTISRQNYGTRESVITRNNVQLEDTLLEHGIGDLWDRKDPTDLPKVTIRDGSINPSNIETGDVVYVKVEGDKYLGTINGVYKIVQIQVSVDLEHMETVNLTLEPPVQRPEPVMVRYIKDTIKGSSANVFAHWVEIQALMNVDGSMVNMAYGITPTCTGTISNPARVTDGDTATANYASVDSGGTQSVMIDLGAEYPIDYIKVWHYYSDGRRYIDNTLSVGTVSKSGNTPLDIILWQYSGQSYVETSAGRQSKWIQGINM